MMLRQQRRRELHRHPADRAARPVDLTDPEGFAQAVLAFIESLSRSPPMALQARLPQPRRLRTAAPWLDASATPPPHDARKQAQSVLPPQGFQWASVVGTGFAPEPTVETLTRRQLA